jgi:hypothetical protein
MRCVMQLALSVGYWGQAAKDAEIAKLGAK